VFLNIQQLQIGKDILISIIGVEGGFPLDSINTTLQFKKKEKISSTFLRDCIVQHCFNVFFLP
jgi:hypothetical protein